MNLESKSTRGIAMKVTIFVEVGLRFVSADHVNRSIEA